MFEFQRHDSRNVQFENAFTELAITVTVSLYLNLRQHT